jgi:hypothetical protein
MCSYCGEEPDTRDHVPSRILLDEPFPENLPVVPCCHKCNQGFSLDEEYIACLIECVICGTTEIDRLQREKIRLTLERNVSLHQKISNAMTSENGHVFFNVEVEQLKNVILKLAKGHAKYENSEPIFEEPRHFGFKPLPIMSQNEIDYFFADTELIKSPEVGSRAMQNLVINKTNKALSHWTTVQLNNYSYCVIQTLESLTVRIIIRNYLAAEMTW